MSNTSPTGKQRTLARRTARALKQQQADPRPLTNRQTAAFERRIIEQGR